MRQSSIQFESAAASPTDWTADCPPAAFPARIPSFKPLSAVERKRSPRSGLAVWAGLTALLVGAAVWLWLDGGGLVLLARG